MDNGVANAAEAAGGLDVIVNNAGVGVNGLQETFTAEEQRVLTPHVTNLDRPVFALTGLSETVKGALFARYSRWQGTLRRLFLEEFAAELPSDGRPFDGIEGSHGVGERLCRRQGVHE